MTMDRKRIGICGITGHMEKFAQIVNESGMALIVSLWDEDQSKAKKLAEKIDCQAYEDVDEMFVKEGLDGVLILTDNYLKADLMLKAAANGVSIFVEKPLCVDLKEAYAVQKAVKQSGVRFYMSDPFVRQGLMFVAKLIKEDELGKINEASFRLSHYHFDKDDLIPYYRKDKRQGGIMADVGGHALHMAHYLFGKPLKLSSVLTYNSDLAKESGCEDNARIEMLYEDDLLASISASFLSKGLQTEINIYGDKAMAKILPGERPGQEIVYIYRGNSDFTVYEKLPEGPKQHILYFLDMLEKGIPNEEVGKDPLSNSGVSIDNAVEYVEIIEAIYRGANKGLIDLNGE